MPYEWTRPPIKNQPQNALRLWPYQSLKPRGFVVFIAITAFMSLFPIVAVLGSAIMWVLLVFAGLTLCAVWYALRVNGRRGQIIEQFTLTADQVQLTRQNPDGGHQDWYANRYWVTVHLHLDGGPVENYLTLRGGAREVEIGRFLDVKERLALYSELKLALPYQPEAKSGP